MSNPYHYFILKESKPRNPYFNLAREEAIALQIHSHSIIGGLRFWENSNSIVLGINDSVEQNVKPEILDNFKQLSEQQKYTARYNPQFTYIARRASGGGTVYQETGMNLNFSIFINLELRPDLYPVKNSYDQLLGLVVQSLAKQNIKATIAGKSDISIVAEEGQLWKISGNAQFRKKNCLVHHGTLILKKDLIYRVESTLQHPPQEPEYRQNRKHSQFIRSLPEEFQTEKFQNDLEQELVTFLKIRKDEFPPTRFFRSVVSESRRLFLEKYKNKDFIFQKP